MEKRKVCVIGAGAAGLCAARHLARDSNEFEFVVFERTAGVGGTWVYTDKVGVDEFGLPIHSSMYKNLRTNLPKEEMCFPDFPFPKGGRSSVLHSVILDYLKNYTDHFQLWQYIKFNMTVDYVKPGKDLNNSGTDKWQVRVRDLKTSAIQELIFDAVLVCIGHYFDPYIPEIPGMSEFKGQVLHSHNYRIPEAFTGKRVLLLGASSSGTDIALDLCGKASQIYLSHNNDRLNQELGFTEVQGVDQFEDGKFVLKDGAKIEADAFMFCTGYNNNFSFLDKSCGIRIDDNYMKPLYKHLINIDHPTMCIVGIPTVVVPFPMFHMQIQYFLSLLKGKSQLPPKPEMVKDSELPAGQKKRHAHKLHKQQWAYNDWLAQAGSFEPLPRFYTFVYEAWSSARKRNLRDYKNFNVVLDQVRGTVEIVE